MKKIIKFVESHYKIVLNNNFYNYYWVYVFSKRYKN